MCVCRALDFSVQYVTAFFEGMLWWYPEDLPVVGGGGPPERPCSCPGPTAGTAGCPSIRPQPGLSHFQVPTE